MAYLAKYSSDLGSVKAWVSSQASHSGDGGSHAVGANGAVEQTAAPAVPSKGASETKAVSVSAPYI